MGSILRKPIRELWDVIPERWRWYILVVKKENLEVVRLVGTAKLVSHRSWKHAPRLAELVGEKVAEFIEQYSPSKYDIVTVRTENLRTLVGELKPVDSFRGVEKEKIF